MKFYCLLCYSTLIWMCMYVFLFFNFFLRFAFVRSHIYNGSPPSQCYKWQIFVYFLKALFCAIILFMNAYSLSVCFFLVFFAYTIRLCSVASSLFERRIWVQFVCRGCPERQQFICQNVECVSALVARRTRTMPENLRQQLQAPKMLRHTHTYNIQKHSFVTNTCHFKH